MPGQKVESMRAAMYHGAKDIRIEQIPVPVTQPGQVKIKVGWCGICGTDLHEYESGPILCPSADKAHDITGEKLPICLGHGKSPSTGNMREASLTRKGRAEFSGTIVEVGDGIKGDWKVGDRVVVEPVISCHKCFACNSGVNNVQIGAMVEPLSVALHAVERSGFKKGDTALVLGAGPIGILTITALIAQGASAVICSEMSAARRKMATLAGAHHVISPRDVDVPEFVRKLTGTDNGVAVAFECAGVQATLDTALASLRTRGTCLNVAIWSTKPIIDMNALLLGEKTLRGVICYKDNHQPAIEALASGKIDLAPFITGRIKLDDLVSKGFHELIHNNENHVKIMASLDGDASQH
ncbi:hypothetical protein MNV49_006659 [Pseudohyphozyma bogoriensis]|nr:hypothetical protein MNV49_006659 [Pseudohyphozyma bogoriensis]